MKTTGLRALIVDDDPLVGELLHHFCKKSGRFSYSVAVERSTEGLNLLSTEDFDLVFLDFNLPDMNGRSFLELLDEHIPVVMVTSEVDFAVDSFSYSQVKDFLTKPLSYDRFAKIFDRLTQNQETEKPSDSSSVLFLKEGHATVRVNLEDIKFIKSEGNYLLYKLNDRKIMTLGSLSKIQDTLPDHFAQNHRSYIANLHHVTEVHPEEIKLGELSIPLSQKNKGEFLARWKNHATLG